MNIIFLPVIFFIGIVTSYEDIRYGKIRNKWILWGFFYWVLMFFLFFLWNLSFDNIFDQLTSFYKQVSLVKFEYSYLSAVIINSFLTIVFVFVLWEFGIIAAGDAKLFWLFSTLVPFAYYWKTYLPFFPSVVLFINTFFLLSVYLLVASIISYIVDNKGRYWELITIKIQNIKQKFKNGELTYDVIIGQIVVFLVIIFTIKIMVDYYSIDVKNLPAYIVILLFFFRRAVKNFISQTNILPYISLYLLILFFIVFKSDPLKAVNIFWNVVRNLIILMTIFSIINTLIVRYIKKTSVVTVAIDDLKKKMILDRSFIRRLKNDTKYYKAKIGRIYPAGLTSKQAEAILKWGKKHGVEEINIFQPFRMAIWIFGGVIATLLYEGSLIKLIMN